MGVRESNRVSSIFESTEWLVRAQRAMEQCRYEEARHAYARALELAPDSIESLRGLGYALFQLRRLTESLDVLARAVDADPTDLLSRLLMGRLCLRLQQPSQAEAHFNVILERIPASEAARSGLIDVLVAQGNLGKAKTIAEEMLAIQPDSEMANLAAARLASWVTDDEQALRHFSKLVQRRPGNSAHAYNRALCLMRLGRFDEAWPGYECRFAAGAVPVTLPDSPRWEGQRVGRLLLIAEQGLGDAILFSRYIPEAARSADRVTFVCPPSLTELFARNLGVECVPPLGGGWPAHDAHVPLMSLPHVLKLGEAAFEARAPYVAPDPDRRARWSKVLGAGDPALLRIGLVSASSAAHSTEENPFTRRSCPAAALRPLTELRGVLAYNLNLGRPAEEAQRDLPALRPLGAPLVDFEDTAAVVSLMDAVVTVDTALVHLAGAVGSRCVVLLPPSADWKWQRAGSPPVWYQTVTQIRASSPGGWARPVKAAVNLVREWLQTPRPLAG